MRTNNRVAVFTAAFGMILLAGVSASPMAAAKGSNPVIHATGGAGSAVDRDGTQGTFTDSVQGTADSDGDQDAYLNGSEEAAPQFKAPHK